MNIPFKTFIKHLACNFVLPIPSLSLHSLSTLSLSQTQNQPQQQPQQDLYALMKQDPIQICSDIWVKAFSTPKSNTFANLSGFLSKFDIWVLAYQRSVAHFSRSFPARNVITSRELDDLLSLRNAVVKGRFKWNMKENPFICRPNEKPMSQRKLQKFLESDLALFQDHVVQEVVLLILEPIFESRFSTRSHGFRPGRNAHTVIRTIRSNFAGYVWFLKGDLGEILGGVDRGLVMGCLEKVVKDRRVLGLISSGLRKNVRVGSECGYDRGESRVVKWKKRKGGEKKIRKKLLNPNEPKPDPY